MKDILTVIDDALKRKGLTAAAASRLAVGNPSLIKNMRQETDKPKRFNAEALRKLAEILDLEFYFGEERELTTLHMPAGFAENTVQPLSSARTRQEALEMGFLPIPYHAAAAPDFRGTAPVALARQWVKASGLASEKLAFLPVVDDDMAPTLKIGSLVMIDTNQTDGAADGIWALGIKRKFVFARIEFPSHDIMILKSDKPDAPVQIVKDDALSATRILGRVVWIVHQS